MEGDEAIAPLLGETAGQNTSVNYPPTDSDEVISFRPIITSSLPKQRAPKFRQIIATLFSSFAPLSFGLVLGYSSPTLAGLTADGILDKDQQTWFASVPTLGALLGALMGGYLVNTFGRKGSLLACGVPFAVGWGMIIAVKATSSYILLLAGRAVCGATMGVVCIAAPTYIAEIASPDMRGALGTVFQVATTVGILLAFVVGLPLDWEWLAVFAAAVAALMTVLLIFVPETPRYLAGKGLETEAKKSLRWLRGDLYNIDEEYEQIQAQVDANPSTSTSFSDFTKKSIYKPVLLSMGLMFFQQCSGINDVLFYSSSIFKSAKFNGDPAIPGMIIAGVQVGATIISVFVIDLLGRRVLLGISGSFMCAGCIAMGVNYYIQDHLHQAGLSWLPIASLILYVAAFSVGLGPIPWTMMAELTPSRVKGVASSIAVITNWLSAFIITKEFNDLEDSLHQYGAFWLFAAINALGVIYTIILLPETKGKSLEEIERYFAS